MREYSGREVFSRSAGDQLWVMMVALDSVLHIARDMRRFLVMSRIMMWRIETSDGRQGNA